MMDVALKVRYAGDGIFDVSRWEQDQLLTEQSGISSRGADGKSRKRSWVYQDGIAVDIIHIPAADGYPHLTISVASNGQRHSCRSVKLRCIPERPVIITFRYFDFFGETMSLEGGVTEEFRGGEDVCLCWEGGNYIK